MEFRVCDKPNAEAAETCSHLFFLGQGGMHVNGAPLMQASMPGGVPAPVQMTAAVAGPGPGSLAPAGNFQLVFTILFLC